MQRRDDDDDKKYGTVELTLAQNTKEITKINSHPRYRSRKIRIFLSQCWIYVLDMIHHLLLLHQIVHAEDPRQICIVQHRDDLNL